MDIVDLMEAYPPINGVKKDSFARFTLCHRLPAILDGMIKDNAFAPEIEADLKSLKNNIILGKIEEQVVSGPDAAQWKNWISPFLGKRWFEVPFYFAEAYFYRIIMEKTCFFANKADPFAIQKKRDIQENMHQLTLILGETGKMKEAGCKPEMQLDHLLNLSLWGNKSDLSQLTKSKNSEGKDLIIDDSATVSAYLASGVRQVDIVLDNSGVELFSDLILAEHLLQAQLAARVVLHTKAFPTFVSDATSNDIEMLLKALKIHENKAPTSTIKRMVDFANRLGGFIENGRIEIEADFFWNSPRHFYEFPESLHHKLGNSDLIIFKGDANYRRIFGDLQLPPELEPGRIASYLPAKSLAIRVLKSEIILGVDREKVLRLSNKDSEWRINGKYGIVQLLN